MVKELIKCPECGSTDIAFVEAKNHINEYMCKKCGSRFWEYGTAFPPFVKLKGKGLKEVI